MKLYQVTGSGNIIEKQIESDDKTKLIKVRVMQVAPTYSDVCFFNGAVKREYPFVCGHTAIGVVSDDRPEFGLKRGAKVIINPYTSDAIDRLDMPGKVTKMGITTDGLMRDFVYLPIDKITPFPEDVHENEAVFAEKIAIAMTTINRLNVQKGDYLAIVGGSAICNIIAQLALYFQLIPIMIDHNAVFLDKAKKCGVYYTVNSTTERPYDVVKEITGGRMVEHTVIEVTNDATGAFIFTLNRDGGNCILLNESKIVKVLNADVSLISKSQLKVTGVSNGAMEFDSAINILAQRILNLDGFIDKTVGIAEAEGLFKELTANPDKYYCPIINM